MRALASWCVWMRRLNSRLEGINAKIRVIQRGGYGHPDPDALAAMIHLCLGGITLTLPGRPTQT